jgi:Tat protein secretion system quality control protein TatD with DNase activity
MTDADPAFSGGTGAGVADSLFKVRCAPAAIAMRIGTTTCGRRSGSSHEARRTATTRHSRPSNWRGYVVAVGEVGLDYHYVIRAIRRSPY